MGHSHNGVLLWCKKKKILSFATACMGLESIMLSEINQSDKDKYHKISLYVESNEQTDLTSKIDSDSWMESRLTPLWGGMGAVDGLSKKEKELMDMDTSVVIVEGRGEGGGIRGYGGINGNGKKTIKNERLKK